MSVFRMKLKCLLCVPSTHATARLGHALPLHFCFGGPFQAQRRMTGEDSLLFLDFLRCSHSLLLSLGRVSLLTLLPSGSDCRGLLDGMRPKRPPAMPETLICLQTKTGRDSSGRTLICTVRSFPLSHAAMSTSLCLHLNR